MKKLMVLGGSLFALPAIEAAHKQGYYVITCDYLPNNVAHKYSDEYHDVSVTDCGAVLKVARECEIDGIISFACDAGAIAAAYVQEKLGLPSIGPYESVCILQNKDKFRQFLSEHGFTVPKAKGFSSIEEALADKCWYSWPVIVKPTDSAGSKGVTRVDSYEKLRPALECAFEHALHGHVIVEEFIEKQGCSSDSDCFSVNGELTFVSFSAQRFDENASGMYVPAAYSWPSTMKMQQEAGLTSELQRLLSLLGMKTAIYNVETRISTNGKGYIMEVSPRAGGNRLAEIVSMATGVDLVTASVRAAVGDEVGDLHFRPYQGYWAEVILHATEDGTFSRLVVNNEKVGAEIIDQMLTVKSGDKVKRFDGGNRAIGTLVVKFQTAEEQEKAMNDISSWVKVELQ